MAAATLVDLARHTTHALAQHFRSYLSRHAGAPGMMRPRGVSFRGVAVDSSGGVRGRNGGLDGKGEERGKVKTEERVRELQKTGSTTTITSTGSRVSASSLSSSGTLASSRDSALIRQMKKGKRWLSKTSHRLATETPRDNRRVKAAALRPRSRDVINVGFTSNSLRPRSGDVMNVGLNAIASTGPERKNILGFDGGLSRNLQTTDSWGRSLAGGGAPQSHIYMTRVRGDNPTEDLVNRLYGLDGAVEKDKKASASDRGKKKSSTGRDKKNSVEKDSKLSSVDGKKKAKAGEKKKKRKRYNIDKEESSSLALKSFDCFSSKGAEDVTKSMLNQKVSARQQVPPSVQASLTSLKPSKRQTKHASDSESVQKIQPADTRGSLSQDFVRQAEASRSISWSDPDPIPLPPATKARKRADVTWREMKEQPDVWADDIKKRLELYSKQYLESKRHLKESHIKSTNEVDKKIIQECSKQIKTDSSKGKYDVTAVKSVTNLTQHEKKNTSKAALVRKLTPELKNSKSEINAKSRTVVTVSRSSKEPQLFVSPDDLSPRNRSKSLKTVEVAIQCEPELKSSKSKSRQRAKKSEKTTSEDSKVRSQNLALLPPATDAEMWSKILIQRMEQIKQAAGVPNEKSSKDVSKQVKDIVKSSVESTQNKNSSGENKVVVYKPMSSPAAVNAAPTEESKLESKPKPVKVLTQRDKQLIEDIRKQWAQKFKAKLNKILKTRERRSPAVKTSSSIAEVFSTPMNSLKTSLSPQRSNNDSVGNVGDNMDDIIDVKPIEHPENKIIPLTQNDLAYWEWIHLSNDAVDEGKPSTEIVHVANPGSNTRSSKKQRKSSSTQTRAANEAHREMRETYLRSDFKTTPAEKPQEEQKAQEEFLPKLKLKKQERRQLRRIIDYLNNLPAKGDHSGCQTLDGLMEMRLVPVDDKPELKPSPTHGQPTATTVTTTADHESSGSLKSSRKSINRHSASDIIHDIHDLLKDGDKLSATLSRQREDKVSDARRELMASYRKNIRRHQRVLERYRGKLWKLREMEVEHRAAKNRRPNFKEH